MATKLREVILEKDENSGPDGNVYTLWCDPDVAKVIDEMPGAHILGFDYPDSAPIAKSQPPYRVQLDPRYDRTELEAEIEAQW